MTSLKQKQRRRQNRGLITLLDEESDEVEDRSDFAVAQDTGSADLIQQHDVAKLQRECLDYKPIFEYIEEGILPQEEKTARKIVFESEQFIIDDGTLYHLFHPRTKRMDEIVPIVKQLCIPRILREDLMECTTASLLVLFHPSSLCVNEISGIRYRHRL